jgi:hypothetical protein
MVRGIFEFETAADPEMQPEPDPDSAITLAPLLREAGSMTLG